ncbi:MAG: hemolysin family protein [Thermoanaerobaculia bacterium]
MLQLMFFEVGLIMVLILANGVFAMSEIAVVSSRRARLERLARGGSRGARAAVRLSANPDRFLSTIQIGITTIGIFAGAYGGATIAKQIDDHLETFPLLAPYSEALGVGIVVVAITYLTLVMGELVPKRLALNAPERVASMVAPFMERLSRIGAPAVAVLGGSTRAVLFLLRVRKSNEPSVTEEELRLMLRQGSEVGAIEREEQIIVERVFRLSDRSVRALMTPRIEVNWLDLTQPLDSLREKAAALPHSRFPVAHERIDRIEGIVTAREVITAPDMASLIAAIQEPLFVPRNTSVYRLLETFRETRNHVAIVIDEYGGMDGIVTPTDILEGLVGELPEIGDSEEPLIFRREDGSWSVDAALDLDELRIAVGIDLFEGQKQGVFQTVAGYVTERLARAPALGDVIVASGRRFEIVEMDGRRIDRLLVHPELPREGKLES